MPPSPALPPLLPQATLRENLIRLVSTVTGAPLSGPTQRDVDKALERGLGMIDSTGLTRTLWQRFRAMGTTEAGGEDSL